MEWILFISKVPT